MVGPVSVEWGGVRQRGSASRISFAVGQEGGTRKSVEASFSKTFSFSYKGHKFFSYTMCSDLGFESVVTIL